MIRQEVFDRLVWKPDRMMLDEFVFRLEHYKNPDWELGSECFIFYKIKELTDQYARFFSRRADFTADRIVELGIWDGGSVAFWFELFQPTKHVAIDLATRQDTAYFERYLASRAASDRVATYWETDQADHSALRRIVQAEFGTERLDLVIDDASHLYAPTKSSFETLFPYLRPGGLYIIEDWAWAHWPAFLSTQKTWREQTPLTEIVFEMVEATGTSPNLISSVAVFQGFIVIERGEETFTDPETFRIENYISRAAKRKTSSPISLPKRIVRHARSNVRRAINRFRS